MSTWRMAISEAALAKGSNFFILELPEPDLAYVTNHSVVWPQAQGGQARQGYVIATLFWNELTAAGAYAIQSRITAAEVVTEPGNGVLWLTMQRNDASNIAPGWIDVSGVALMPEFAPEQSAQGLKYPNVTLTLNNVTIVNEPSDYA